MSAGPRTADGGLRTLIDDLLAEQGVLATPVARFSDQHDREPELAGHYRSLIPLERPAPGEQYAFEVALDRCTGCKACVSACHSLNGLDEGETWRETGALMGGPGDGGWQQTVTSACHHCEDPGCLNGCPVAAYVKEPDTGIVRHLDDQCIGCSYCILKCPYDVPKYSKKRGIVRKCDMCHQRLAAGEAPACVQACPTEAIRIVKRPTGRVLGFEGDDGFLPGGICEESAVPDLRITRPTTRYVGRQVPQGARAADRERLRPEHAHWPLVWMLLLTQAGIGLLLGGGAQVSVALLGATLFYLGMAASVLHLGRPLKAWRFFLGLRTSWLSREILAFSLFAPLPALWCAGLYLAERFPIAPWFPVARIAMALAGGAAVFTSVMIYHDTARRLWRFPRTASRFFGTVVSCAWVGACLVEPSPVLALAGAAFILLRMAPEASLLKGAPWDEEAWTPDLHSGKLLLGPLRRPLHARFLLGCCAALTLLVEPWLALPLLLAADLFERQLFFQSVYAPRMPGATGAAGDSGN